MRINDLKCAVIGGSPIVRLVTDEGICGYGQVEHFKPYLKPFVMLLREAVVGQDPTDVERVMLRCGRAAPSSPMARRSRRWRWRFGISPGRRQYTEHYRQLQAATSVLICTGEDIYLKENFELLLKSGISVIHPDLLTSGGILETKKIGDMAQDHGVATAIHMAESPIAAMAAAHVAVATENFMALEYHSVDVPWWDDIVAGLPKPLVKDGFIEVPDKADFGIDDIVDEVIKGHLQPGVTGVWQQTDHWDDEYSWDRTWS